MLTDALPNGTVSGDVGDVERSSDHLVMMRLPAGVSKCTRASQIRHPGQDGAGKQCVPVHPVTGVGDGQAASGRNIQGV